MKITDRSRIGGRTRWLASLTGIGVLGMLALGVQPASAATGHKTNHTYTICTSSHVEVRLNGYHVQWLYQGSQFTVQSYRAGYDHAYGFTAAPNNNYGYVVNGSFCANS